MIFLFSLGLSILWAQEIRLRLLHDQKSIPMVAEQIRWQEETSKSLVIQFSETSKEWLIYNPSTKVYKKNSSPKLEITAKNARIYERNVNGNFYLIWNSKRKAIDLIYPMALDKYLLGVIPSEMPSSWPLEALKAQVVASRSYVLAQMQAQTDREFDVDATVMDQVFNKSKFESLPKALQDKVRLAISSTQKEVLFKDQKIYKTYFHAQCGGHTENPRTVWNDAWKWQGKKDPYCLLSSAHNWSYSLSLSTLAKFYTKNTQEPLGEITKVVSGDRTSSGRADHIFLFFTDGRIRRWSTQDLRAEAGFSNIKSTLFTIQKDKDQISFRGKGFGHGVGLCQYGARQMATLGKKYQEILDFYYPSAELRAVFDWPSFIAKLHRNTF